MFEYVWRDLLDALRYYPYALAAGGVFFVLFLLFRRKKNVPFFGKILFVMCVAVLLCMTLLFRESGGKKGMDFTLFSTWGINARNNAFVIENIILFIPYGFVTALAFPKLRNFFACSFFGLFTSIAIELIQYTTQRGFFQIDDIITNGIGAMIGCILFWIIYFPVWCRKKPKKGKKKS